MALNDGEPPKIQLDLKGLTESESKLLRRLHGYIETVITAEMMNFRNYFKNMVKLQDDKIETIGETIDFQLKETNYRIGALRGHQTKNKDADAVDLTDPEQALAFANKRRAEHGLKPLSRKDLGLE